MRWNVEIFSVNFGHPYYVNGIVKFIQGKCLVIQLIA